jgi:hypothetical protein
MDSSIQLRPSSVLEQNWTSRLFHFTTVISVSILLNVMGSFNSDMT